MPVLLSLFFFLIFAISADDKHFVIDICSYNNQQWYEKNLCSVFNQDYPNWRVIYTNDCSSDDTGQLVEELVDRYGMQSKVRVVHNKDRQRMLGNHWRVIHQCDDDEIIIHLDGDDWFAHEGVLSRLNEIYQDENVWLAYGSYQFWPALERYDLGSIPAKVIQENTYRKTNFRKSPYHPRTFYAWLAKKIKLEDLLYPHKPFAGQFTPAISDWSLLYPLFEMAGGRFACIDEVLYSFNVINPLNHDKDKKQLALQKKCAAYVCRKKPYEALEQKSASIRSVPSSIDVLIFNPLKKDTRMARESALKYCVNVREAYEIQGHDHLNYESLTPYVMVIDAQSFFKHVVDLQACCTNLEITGAQAFYFHADYGPRQTVWLRDDVQAFSYRLNGRFQLPSTFMCRKQDLEKLLEVDKVLKKGSRAGKDNIALCYDNPHLAR